MEGSLSSSKLSERLWRFVHPTTIWDHAFENYLLFQQTRTKYFSVGHNSILYYWNKINKAPTILKSNIGLMMSYLFHSYIVKRGRAGYFASFPWSGLYPTSSLGKMDPIPKLGEVLPSKVHIKLTSTPRALCDRESNDNIRF